MLKRVSLALFVLFSTSGALFAQATAALNGRVVDQAGAVLPGATVTITNVATGATRDTVTNAEGLYTVPALNPGTYNVKAELSGFSVTERKNIELITGSNLSVDVAMGLAGIQENLTVTGQAPLIEASQAVLASSIRQAEVETLPMLNRTMASLMALLPGARDLSGGTSAHGTSPNYISVGGGGGANYNMLVDGIDNKEDHCGGTEIVYSLDGIQEFKLMAAGSSAEYGKGTATVLMATRSGTNELKGTGYLYGRDQRLVATDYFSQPKNGGLGKPPFKRLQYGGSGGGPIVRDRAWWFGSVERVQQDSPIVRSQLQFNETEILRTTLLPDIKNAHVYGQPSRDLLTQAKVNAQLSHDHTAYVRYSGEVGYIDSASAGTSYFSWATPDSRNKQNLWNVASGWTWVISPTTVNQLTGQFMTFTHDNVYPACPLSATNLGVDLGVNNCLPIHLGFTSTTTGIANAFPHWYNFEDKWEIRDDFSKQFGRHALKFGVDYTHMPVFGGIFGGGSPGTITFFDDPSTIVNNSNGRYPQGFATPGIVRSITETTSVIGDYGSSGNWGLGVYMQNDLKVSPRLTLNLGLRWDGYNFLNTPENLATNRTYQVLKAIGSPYASEFPSWDKNNWSPRIGVAWDLHGDGKDVVRASWGMYYIQIIKNTTYQREFLQKDILYVSTATSDPSLGCVQSATCPLGNFIYGVTPLPPTPVAPTNLPSNSAGYWYEPNWKDAQTMQSHVGWAHLFPHETVLAIDYSNHLGKYGMRNLNINPLINGVRPLAADFQRMYGDPRLMSTVNIMSPVDEWQYDEVATHFERRFSAKTSITVNYTLAWARGMGGVSDGTTHSAPGAPQLASPTGGDIYAPWEWGYTGTDERHRVTLAGNLTLPFQIDVSPSMTAATPRAYTQTRGSNPSGDGSLQLLCPSGDSTNVGFGVGQVPCGIGNVRGFALFNLNARVTKYLSIGSDKLGLFAELYNLTNRTNFGTSIGSASNNLATYGKPTGYAGGTQATSTIPNSRQMQFGVRYSF
jgi:hypothetical protein